MRCVASWTTSCAYDDLDDGFVPALTDICLPVTLPQASKTIIHGSVATITVEDGEVAVIRNVGKRQTLGPGRYKLEAPQQVLQLG